MLDLTPNPFFENLEFCVGVILKSISAYFQLLGKLYRLPVAVERASSSADLTGCGSLDAALPECGVLAVIATSRVASLWSLSSCRVAGIRPLFGSYPWSRLAFKCSPTYIRKHGVTNCLD